MYAVLLAMTLFVSLGIYFYGKDAEEGEFETQFRADADRLLDSFREIANRNLIAADMMAISLTSLALATNQGKRKSTRTARQPYNHHSS